MTIRNVYIEHNMLAFRTEFIRRERKSMKNDTNMHSFLFRLPLKKKRKSSEKKLNFRIGKKT